MGLKCNKFSVLILLFLSDFCFAQIKQCIQNGGNYDCVPAVLKYCPTGFSPDLTQCVEDPQAYCSRNWVDRTDEEWGKLGFVAYSNPRFQADDPSKPSSGKCIFDARSLRTGETSISNGTRLGFPFMDCSSAPSHQTQISDSSGLWCAKIIEYVAGAPPINPTPQHCSGNPVDTSNGIKIQKEVDIYSREINQVSFERTYNNGNKSEGASWFNPYQKTLRIITPEKIIIGGKKSSPYTSKSQACTSGWSEIKSNITESWAQGTTPNM